MNAPARAAVTSELVESFRGRYHLDDATIDWEQRNADMRKRLETNSAVVSVSALTSEELMDCLGSLAEPAYGEVSTGAFVADYLLALRYKLNARTGMKFGESGGTSSCPDTEVVVGDLRSAKVVFRVDLDAVVFAKDVYRHVCGHAVNLAAVLEVAETLARSSIKDEVAFIFQPAEEGAGSKSLGGYEHTDGFGGGQYLRHKGVYREVDTLVSCHIDTSLKPHQVRITPGLATAAGYSVRFECRGRRAHAALPWDGVNPVDGLGRFLEEMRQLNVRFKGLEATEYGLVTITQVSTAECDLNTLADSVVAQGIARIVSQRAAGMMKDALRSVGATWQMEAPPVVNDAELAARAHAVATSLGFEVVPEPARFRDETAWAGELGEQEPGDSACPPGARRILHIFVSGGSECGPLHSEHFSGDVESVHWQVNMLTGIAKSITDCR